MYSKVKLCGQEYRFRLTMGELKEAGGFEALSLGDQAITEKISYLGLKNHNENFPPFEKFQELFEKASIKEGIALAKAIEEQTTWDYPKASQAKKKK